MNQTPVQLLRVLGPWMATAIVVGTVIGSGVFKKARNVSENVPEFGLAMSVWVLGGVLALLGAFALAEVAVLYPRAGGNYVFLREAYGRWAGFLWGWVEFWIIRSASIAALGSMFTESFHDILKEVLHPGASVEVLGFWPRQLMTALVIAGLTLVNIRGTLLGGGLQLAITALKVGSLLFIIALPFAVLAAVSEPTHKPQASFLMPTWPADWLAIDWGKYGAALVAVLWAYNGWMNIAPVAGEVIRPNRNIPFALFAGILILMGLYCGANVGYYLIIPRDQMMNLKDTTVATEFCLRLLGPIGAMLASAIIMTSVFGALNGNLLVGPRVLFAMGDDNLAPRILYRLHARYGTPAIATIAMAGWSCLLVLGLGALLQTDWGLFDTGKFDAIGKPIQKSPFDVITDFAIFGSVVFETLAVGSIFIFRRRIPPTAENRPFRCWGYPVVPALYIAIMIAVLGNMFYTPEQRTESTIGLGFMAVGAAVYWLVYRGMKASGQKEY